jgi:hypothetical protein
MRVVWSLIVASTVALGGVARADSRCEPRAAAIAQAETVVAVIHAVATRPVSHLASTRTRTRGVERRLPAAALAAAFVLRAPPRRVVVELPLAAACVASRLLATGSARGPPIA